MRILLLDTGRGAGPETIATWRDRLGLRPEDEVALLGWNPPREPLPVTTHLVFGPDLRPVPTPPRRVEVAPVAGGSPATTTSSAAAADVPGVPVPDAGPDGPLAASGVDAEVDGQSDDATAEISEAAASEGTGAVTDGPATPAPATPSPRETAAREATDRRARIAGLPVYHPERLAQAARWRAGKAQTFGRRAAGRARREVVKRSTITPERRRVIANNAISAQFGMSALASPQTRELFARADLVLPMDTRSQPAAWLLAQRIAGPDVVVGIPAAQRILAERRG